MSFFFSDKQPEATKVVFLSQFLKWFAYYGVISLLASFLTKGLGYSESYIIVLISQYLTLVNIFIFIGGVVADKFLGIRRSFLLGNIYYFLALSFLALLAWSAGGDVGSYTILVIIMFIFLSMAGTTMNSTASVLLTKAHQSNNSTSSLDISYSYNYFFSGLGSVLGKILFPLLIGTSFGILWGYKIAFSLSAGLTFVAVFNIILNYHKLNGAISEIDNKPLGYKGLILGIYFIVLFAIHFLAFHLDEVYLKIFSLLLFLSALLYFVYLIIKAEKSDKIGMWIALIICLQMIVFFVYRNQVFTTLSLYPIHIMKPFKIFGLTIGGEMALSFNAFWAVIGTPLIIAFLNKFSKQKNKEWHVGYKFVIGLLLTSLSYGIFWYSTVYALKYDLSELSILWFFVGHAFVAIAEIFIMNLALSSLSLLVPKNLTATTLGLHYMSMGIGALIAGQLAQTVALQTDVQYTSAEIFSIYQPFFLKLTWAAIFFVAVFFLTTRFIRFLESKRN